MSEGPSFPVSRDLPNACEEENQWASNTSQMIELSNRKRPLEEKEDAGLKKLSKLQEEMEKEETQPVLLNLFPLEVQPVLRHHKRDTDDTSSFIHDLGRDLSLNSLYDYNASDRPVSQRRSGHNSNPNLCGLDLSLNCLVPCSRSDHGSAGSIQPGTQHDSRDDYDSSSLIHRIGRDLSINCLLHCSRSNYNSISRLNRGFRSLIQSGEIYRLRRQMGIVEQWVYLCCNLIQWEAFDTVSCKWMRLPRIESNECFMCADKESLAVGTVVLVFGRQIDSLVIYKYSLSTNSWSTGTKTNIPRCLFGSASLGEIAIVAGGCDLRGNILNSAELYNSDRGTWEILPSMNHPRKLCAAVFMDGKFYVIGGVGRGNPNAGGVGTINPNAGGVGTSNPNVLASITSGEVYDLRTKSWQEIPNMYPSFGAADNDTPVTSKAPPLLAVVKNELYAAYYAKQELWKYDKERNNWNRLGKLPEQATSLHGWGLAFRACGNLLLVISGSKSNSGGFVEISAWEPNDEGPPDWTSMGRKHSCGFVYNCAVMGC